MTKGMLSSTTYPRDREWTRYGTSEGLPLIDATVTTPTLNHGDAAYLLVGDTCYFYIRINLKTAGSGAYVLLAPPVDIPYYPSWNQGTVVAGSLTAAQTATFGIVNATYPLAYIRDELATPLIPRDRRMTVFPSPTNSIGLPSGVATVTSGTKTKVVTHGGALAPDTVHINPTTSQAAAGCVDWWVDTVTATQFTINAQAAAGGNLTGNLSFAWHTRGPVNGTNNAGIFMTDKFPWGWANGDRMDISGWLPLRTTPPRSY